MIFRDVVAEVVVCGADHVDKGSGDNIDINIVCHQGLIEILQLVGKSKSCDKACGDYATLTLQLDRRSPDFFAVASVVGPVRMGSQRQVIHLIRSHAGEEVGHPRIGDRCVKGISDCGVHIAKLCCEIFVLVGRMNIREIVCPAGIKSLIIFIQPLIVRRNVGHQIGYGHIAVCEILSDRLVHRRDLCLENAA